MKKTSSLTGIHLIVLLLLSAAGIFCFLDTGIQFMGRSLHSPLVGGILLLIALMDFTGMDFFKGTPLGKRPVVVPQPREPATPLRNQQDEKRFRRNWANFAREFKAAILGTDHLFIMVVPDDGMSRIEHNGESLLLFGNPDDSYLWDNYEEFYVDIALQGPPEYAFIKAHIQGLDHNHVLYVEIKLTGTTQEEPQYTITFDPDWKKLTSLVLEFDTEKGNWVPYDTVDFKREYGMQ